jgi:hypothetical protein
LPNMPVAGVPNTSMPNMVGNAPSSMPTGFPSSAPSAAPVGLTGSSASYRMADNTPMPSAANMPAGAFPTNQNPSQPTGTLPPGVPPTGAFPGSPPALAPAGSTTVPAGFRPGSTRESTYDFSRSATGATSGIPPMPSVGGTAPAAPPQNPAPTQFPNSFPSSGPTGLPTFNGGSITR